MKHGTEYAKRLKRLYHDLVSKHGKPAAVEPADPLEQLVIGILAIDSTETKAQAVYRKITQQMVDLNELRVTPALELAEMIGDAVPHATDKARRIVEALNAVRRRQDTLDLSFLKQRGRREAREYLESLDGVPRAAAASVVLFSLGGHAIPVDDLTLYILRKEEMVDPMVDAVEAQAFLERHITAAEAPIFTLLLSRYVSSHALRVDVELIPALMHPPVPKPIQEKPAASVGTSVVLPVQTKPEPVPARPGIKPGAVAKATSRPEPPKSPAKSESGKPSAKPAVVAKTEIAAKPEASAKPLLRRDGGAKPPSKAEAATKAASKPEAASKAAKQETAPRTHAKTEPAPSAKTSPKAEGASKAPAKTAGKAELSSKPAAKPKKTTATTRPKK